MKRAIPWFAILLAFGVANADSSSASEARTVPAFHAIELAGTLEVEVAIGGPARVEVTGEADLLGKVKTTVKNGVLVIDTEPHLRRHHVRAIVTTPGVSSLAISGTGAMKVTGLANDSLAISVTGTGAITAAGTTGSLRVVVDGTGEVSAKDLTAKDATVEVAGTGSATLRATQSVDVKISGTGSVDILGRPPRVTKSVSGVGAVHVR